MSVEMHSIRKFFSHYISSNKLSGRLAEIVQALAEESIQSTRLRNLIPLQDDREYLALRSDVLDLVLLYIASCLEDHYLTSNESSDVYYLKAVFHIQEEDFYVYKYTRVEEMLSTQVVRILGDESVDRTEALQQVELQRCFGLSYDQFLKITRPHVDKIVNKLFELVTADNAVTLDERAIFIQQILALETVYFLTAEQKSALEELAK